MQVTNNPADIVTDKEMEYLRDANERQTRQFAAIIAERNDTILDQVMVGTLQPHRQLNLPIFHDEKFLELLLVPRVPLCRLLACFDSTFQYLCKTKYSKC